MIEEALGAARHDAKAAADESGVEVRPITSLADCAEVRKLFDATWAGDPTNPAMTVELLRALTKAGAYVAGAYRGQQLVGATVGFFGPPRERSLHSHITGVCSSTRGRHVGLALKLHQRAWALEHGLTSIMWTFDPLVRRNAYFNIAKLGARPVEYLRNFYGAMGDQLNRDGESDRLLVRWDLRSPFEGAPSEHPAADSAGDALVVAADGHPRSQLSDASLLRIATPPDIEGIRASDSALDAQWRSALREQLGERMLRGSVVVGFDRLGRYIVDTREKAGHTDEA